MDLEALDLEELLDTGLTVMIQIDSSHEDVEIPDHLKKNSYIVLEVGHNMSVPIPDLELTQDGVSCTLSFNRSPFQCFLPWESIVGYGGEAVNQVVREHNKSRTVQGQSSAPPAPVPKDENGRVIRPDWLRVIPGGNEN